MLPILSQNTSQIQLSRNCLKGWLGNVHRHLCIPTRFPVFCSPPWQFSFLKQTFLNRASTLCALCIIPAARAWHSPYWCLQLSCSRLTVEYRSLSAISRHLCPTGWQGQREKVRSWPHTVPSTSWLQLSSWPATLSLLPCEPRAHFWLPVQVWIAPGKAFPLFCVLQKWELAAAPGGARLQDCPWGKGLLRHGMVPSSCYNSSEIVQSTIASCNIWGLFLSSIWSPWCNMSPTRLSKFIFLMPLML